MIAVDHLKCPKSLRFDHSVARHGTAIHRAIATVLLAGTASTSVVDEAVREAIGLGRHDRGAYVAVFTGVRAYLGRGRPGPEWQFAASEYRVGSAIADFVFVRPDTWPGEPVAVLIDELKTGFSRATISSAATLDQLLRLLDGGHARWPGRFVGVRLVAPSFGLAHLISEPTDLLALKEGGI